jgi:hypothetical protein
MPVVSTLTVDLVARTASFEGPMGKASDTGKKSAKDIQDSFNKMDLGEARGSIMVLGEEIGVHLPRHVQAFVATLPGVAAAMDAAFPVLAVIAIGAAIYKATESAQKHREEMEKDRQAVLNNVDAMVKHTESMQMSNLKLQDQIALLEGRPAKNKLMEALLEAKGAAGDLFHELQNVNNMAIASLEKLSAGGLNAEWLTGVVRTSSETEDATNKIKALSNAQKAYFDAVQRGGLTVTREDEVKRATAEVEKLALAWKEATDARVNDNSRVRKPNQGLNSQGFQEFHFEIDPRLHQAAEAKVQNERIAQNQIFAIVSQSQQQMTAMQEAQVGIRKKGTLEQADADIQNLDKVYAATKQVTAEQTKQAIAGYQVQFDQGKITAEQLAELKQQSLDKQYQAELAHLEKVKALEAGRPELVKQTDQQIAALNSSHQAQILSAYAATLAKQSELNKSFYLSVLADNDKDVAEFQKGIQAKAKATIDFQKSYQSGFDKILLLTKEIGDQDALQAQNLAVATGHMTQQQAVQQALATLDKNKADALANINHELDAQLAKVNALAQAGGTTNNPAYNQAVLAYQSMEAKKLEITKQFNQQINAENLKAANNEQSQWRKMALDFGQVQQHMNDLARQSLGQMNSSIAAFVVTGTGNFRQLAVSAAESFVSMALEYVESKTIMLAIDALFGGNRDKDKEKAIAGNVMLASSAAAVSAAQTLALTSAVFLPPVPESLAAMAYSVGMGFAGLASAERGAILPNREMLVHTHPNEMILPQNIANFMVNAASNSSGTGGGTHHHIFAPVFAPVIHAVDGTGVDRMLQVHGDKFKRHMMQELRNMNY